MIDEEKKKGLVTQENKNLKKNDEKEKKVIEKEKVQKKDLKNENEKK